MFIFILIFWPLDAAVASAAEAWAVSSPGNSAAAAFASSTVVCKSVRRVSTLSVYSSFAADKFVTTLLLDTHLSNIYLYCKASLELSLYDCPPTIWW